MTASAAAGRPATKPPLDTSNYTDLMLRWVRPGTALHRCLLAQRASPTAFAQKVRALSPSPMRTATDAVSFHRIQTASVQ